MSTRAVYPGSFDPLTNGHLDLIERSLRIFDELVVAVVTNPAKTGLFADAERVEMIREATEGFRAIEVVIFDGLLVELVGRVGARAIIRGLRAVSDFEFEFQLANMSRHLDREIETVFLTPQEQFTFISSTLVREIAVLGGNVAEFVHPIVEAELKKQRRV